MNDLHKPSLPKGTTRKEIGARLRLTRKALGIIPSQVCRDLGIRRSTWSMDEAGKALPNVFDMIRFCAMYGATLDWIYQGKMSGLDYELAQKIKIIEQNTDEES